jgi:hypothetical protein
MRRATTHTRSPDVGPDDPHFLSSFNRNSLISRYRIVVFLVFEAIRVHPGKPNQLLSDCGCQWPEKRRVPFGYVI